MEVNFISRDHIDSQKWDYRVEQSAHGLPYALSGYLDIATGKKWEALATEDYQYILPLPFENKLGLKFYQQPFLSQQLGIIGEKVSETICKEFLDRIPTNFAHLNLKGNEGNLFSHHKFQCNQRINLVINLNDAYSSLNANFSKSLKKRVRQSSAYYELKTQESISELVAYYKAEMETRLKLGNEKYSQAEQLLKFLVKHNLGFGIQAISSNGHPDAQLFIVRSKNRLINLFGASNASGKENYAMHFLLNQMIEQYAGQRLLLDFEGSELPGVQEFYESFGATNQPYPEISLDQLPWWYKALAALKNLEDK